MKLSLKQFRAGAMVLGLMLLSGWAGFNFGKKSTSLVSGPVFINRDSPANKQELDLSLFWKVWDKLYDSYLIKEQLQPEVMIFGAIKGMTQALGDPYTVFLPPDDNKESKEQLNGAFEGVGIQLGFKEKQLAVIAPLEGMPAKAAGIRAGDYILHIKDESKGIDQDTQELSLPEAVKLIRGEKGTSVELTILHDGEAEPLAVSIRRDTIIVKSVSLSWIGDDEDIAFLQLSQFGGRTEEEWSEAVTAINQRQNRGVILDLRNNPGGYLQTAVSLAGEFLPAGKLVVSQENARGQKETYSVDRAGKLIRVPLVVLVNEGSASSSEIMAGAINDYDRAKLVGNKTFGKGTVQEALEVGDSAGLHVTTAKWLLPGGQWVNDTKGITPDFEVKDDPATEVDEQLVQAMEVL